jgi:hypothetical protein
MAAARSDMTQLYSPPFRRATHLSVVWAVTLSVLTLIEWRGLDRDPLGQPLFLPYIERSISAVAAPQSPSEFAPGDGAGQAGLHYEVLIDFNGPLFLLCFFGPVLIFFGIGWVARLFSGGR